MKYMGTIEAFYYQCLFANSLSELKAVLKGHRWHFYKLTAEAQLQIREHFRRLACEERGEDWKKSK